MPRVKGLAFRSVLQAHSSLRGPAELERTWSTLGPAIAASIRTPLASAWYPLNHYAALWEAIQQGTNQNADYPRLVGRRCAEQDLKTVHKLVFAALHTTLILSATSRLFSSYYDTGTCVSQRIDPRCLHFVFEGCAGFTLPMWAEVRGSIELYVELSTSNPVCSAFTHGGRTGDASSVIQVTW